MNILIYADEGVNTFSLQETLATFRALFPPASIQLITHQLVAAGGWEEKATLFIIPGGRDIPYDRRLKGEGVTRIKQYVEEGGKFLGICAGAYFAATEVIFEKGTDLEVHEKRDLRFFPGSAIGTLFPFRSFAYGSETGAHAPLIDLQNETLPFYYNGGCYFADATAYPVQVLGTYTDHKNKAAIVSCPVGKGKALLTGVHFEVRSAALLKENTSSEICSILNESEERRQNFLKKIINNLIF